MKRERWTAHSFLLQEDGADQALDSVFVGEDADNLGATFDFAVEAFEPVGGMIFVQCSFGKAV